jgi:hypothetical protein
LAVIATGNDLNIYGGMLGAGTVPTNVFIAGSLNWTAGNVLIPLNKSLAISNSLITAAGVNYTAGSLIVSNAGPSLTVGDKFVIFSQPVANGHTIPIVSPYATFQNDLETDGSITVKTVVQPAAPSLNLPSLLNASNIVISATNNFGPGGTYTLFGTNNIAAPITNWPIVSSGSFDATGQLFITNTVNKGPFFYYLRQP